MRKTTYEHKMDMAFVMIVFCVFAMSVLIVLSLGGSIYKNMSQKIQSGYDEQTCLSYIWSKVKNGDGDGRIYVGDIDGIPALCIEEDYDGDKYITKIYLYDDWVREMVGDSELEFPPDSGMPVIKAASLSFEQMDDNIIKAESDTGELYIYPRAQTGLARP